jgi:riboflavin synthase
VFTGLISDLGTVAALDREDDGAVLTIATRLADELGEGDSVAVDGVCLTATALTRAGFSAQAMRETLGRSSLGELRPGSPVNLELALRPADRLGGHIVQGHVDGVGTVSGVREDGFARVVSIEPPEPLLRYIVEKGSVAVQGVSLTVSELREEGFSVALIPETLVRTNLGRLRAGSRVNLEADMLAKHVERLMEARV